MTASPRQPANRPHPPEAPEESRAGRPAEDRLETLLADPIVQLLMERDGVERDVLLRMARTVRSRAYESRDRGNSCR